MTNTPPGDDVVRTFNDGGPHPTPGDRIRGSDPDQTLVFGRVGVVKSSTPGMPIAWFAKTDDRPAGRWPVTRWVALPALPSRADELEQHAPTAPKAAPAWGTAPPPPAPGDEGFLAWQQETVDRLIHQLDDGLAEVGLGIDSEISWVDGRFDGGTIVIAERDVDAPTYDTEEDGRG